VLRGGGDDFPVIEIRPASISLDPTAELQKWAVGIHYWAVQGFIHGAYVPVRRGINCRWFVDGRDAFYALSAAIATAQHNVLLSSWRLVRTSSVVPSLRLRVSCALTTSVCGVRVQLRCTCVASRRSARRTVSTICCCARRARA
jgi:phosphatidylserine/phosphatidylglycerophosphate/cardiolipin synthase-like enzyme